MARRKLEDVLAALAAARKDPTSAVALAEIHQALAGRSPHAVSRSAKIVGEAEVVALLPELLAAFDRFFEEPDPGCSAKAAVADALYRIGHDDPAPFLRGIRHVQMEPVFGGRVDTAVDLPGSCALGLAAWAIATPCCTSPTSWRTPRRRPGSRPPGRSHIEAGKTARRSSG